MSDSPSALGGRLAVSMGPRSDVEAAHSESSQGVHSRQEVEPTPQFDGTLRSSGGNLRIADWLFRSSAASLIWLVVRVVIGYWWINAGYQKIWGSEKSAFWFGGGAGVKGFAAAGVAGSATGKGGASYGWWAAFLHNFVIPNASWIAKFIALGELAIGSPSSSGCSRACRVVRAHTQSRLHVHRIRGRQPCVCDPRSTSHSGLAQRRVPRSRPVCPQRRLAETPLLKGRRSCLTWPDHGPRSGPHTLIRQRLGSARPQSLTS